MTYPGFWEWCKDWYDDNFYEMPEATYQNPINIQTKNHKNRVLRSGSWFFEPYLCRLGFRSRDIPNHWDNQLGFRFAKSL